MRALRRDFVPAPYHFVRAPHRRAGATARGAHTPGPPPPSAPPRSPASERSNVATRASGSDSGSPLADAKPICLERRAAQREGARGAEDASRAWEQLIWALLAALGLATGAVVLLALAVAALAAFMFVDARRCAVEPSAHGAASTREARTAKVQPSPPTPSSARQLVREMRARLSDALEAYQRAATTPSPPSSPITGAHTPARSQPRAGATAALRSPQHRPPQDGCVRDCEVIALETEVSDLGEVCRGLERVAMWQSAECRAKAERLQHLHVRLSAACMAHDHPVSTPSTGTGGSGGEEDDLETSPGAPLPVALRDDGGAPRERRVWPFSSDATADGVQRHDDEHSLFEVDSLIAPLRTHPDEALAALRCVRPPPLTT